LSPAFLSAEVGLLDPPELPKSKSKRAKKGHRSSKRDQRGAKVVKFPKKRWLTTLDDFRNWLIREAA